MLFVIGKSPFLAMNVEAIKLGNRSLILLNETNVDFSSDFSDSKIERNDIEERKQPFGFACSLPPISSQISAGENFCNYLRKRRTAETFPNLLCPSLFQLSQKCRAKSS